MTIRRYLHLSLFSSRLWINVTNAIKKRDQKEATVEKTKLEDAQRLATKERAGEWVPRLFRKNAAGEWTYRYIKYVLLCSLLSYLSFAPLFVAL